ncbi:MAG: phage terminase large subunit [bacterium]|nr:phage terminase large subunit [bacterium]
MRKPPQTKRKLSAVAQAQLGTQRTCLDCEQLKEITESNYKPLKKGLLGWSEVCNSCRARGSKVKEHKYNAELITSDDIGALIEEMYAHPVTSQVCLDAADALGAEVKRLAETDRRASFDLFTRVVEPLVANWTTPGEIHEDIKDGLHDPNDSLIIATRFSAKSTLTSIFVAWLIFLDPLLKILVISRGATLAKRMLRTVRHVYIAACPMLRTLIPDEDCLDNAEQFQTPASLQQFTGGPTFSSMGITSNIVGLRSDITICDDVEGPKDDTPEKVVQLREKLNEIHMINPKGKKIMLGTYQTEFSVYAMLASEKDELGRPVWAEHRACMFEEDENGIHSRWPDQFSEEDGIRWRRRVTQRAWRLHVLLIADPSILNEKPLKISQFVLMDWEPDRIEFPRVIRGRGQDLHHVTTWGAPDGDIWRGPLEIDEQVLPYVETVMSVDPASGLAGRDAIGVAVLSITPGAQGVVRHLAAIRGPDKMDNIRRVAAVAYRFNPSVVLVEELEDGLFGETLENQMLLLGVPAFVEKVNSGGVQKGRRIIESLSPPMAAGRIIIPRSVAESDDGGDFVNQLVSISWDGRISSTNDDIVDALAHAVRHCKGSLIADMVEALAETRRSAVLDWTNRQTFGPVIDEILREEDEVEANLQERLAAYGEAVRAALQAGDMATANALKGRIRETNNNLRQLRDIQMRML